MAGLDNIPTTEENNGVQTQSVQIAIEKLPEDSIEKINTLNSKLNNLVSSFGQIYIRKREITDEISKLDEILETGEDEFKSTNLELKQIIDELDDKFPQGRINMQDGTIQYQPGAPTRKQVEQQQFEAQNQPAGSGMKVVKQ
jgi:predicted nuclease with TOPRIM domain